VRVVAVHEEIRRIPTRTFLEPIYIRLPHYIRALQELGVPPPFGVSISLIGVEGAILGIGNNDWAEDQYPIDRERHEHPTFYFGD